ncbi:hypothetical protein [Cellulomonas sp. ATA003]|uniref:hypothetical protein n=1 Tax=Cellulomonas sp. ATA003 TaxID=3073064 RepID=UPI0037C17D29
MIGNAVTSNSCSGTCLIFSSARHPKATDVVRAWAVVDGVRTRARRAPRSLQVR